MFYPGDAEGVGHPERDGGDVGVEVACRLAGPRMWDVEGCAAGATLERFNVKLRHATVGNVVVKQAKEADTAFGDPDGHDSVHHAFLWQRSNVGVVPNAYQCSNCKGLVKV